MDIRDGIAYAEEPTPPIRVQGVKPIDGRKLWLRFGRGNPEETCRTGVPGDRSLPGRGRPLSQCTGYLKGEHHDCTHRYNKHPD